MPFNPDSQDLLSKSKHYDWKLRAIKTTLYVAGGMKRAAPDLTEDKVGQQQGPTGGGCTRLSLQHGTRFHHSLSIKLVSCIT